MTGKFIAREPIKQEQRWGARARLHAMVELIAVDGVVEAVCVRDASVSGAFVETRRAWPMMRRVALCPTGRSGKWLDGIIVRAGDGGYGIEWLDPVLHPVSALLSLRQCAVDTPPPSEPRPSRVSWRLVERLKR